MLRKNAAYTLKQYLKNNKIFLFALKRSDQRKSKK